MNETYVILELEIKNNTIDKTLNFNLQIEPGGFENYSQNHPFIRSFKLEPKEKERFFVELGKAKTTECPINYKFINKDEESLKADTLDYLNVKKEEELKTIDISTQNVQASFEPHVIHDVFISHSSKDKEIADAVCNYLEEAKIKCWIAPRDTLGAYAGNITRAIEKSKLMVLIFSNNANRSGKVKNEVEIADTKGITIQPFRIKDVEPDDDLKFYIKRWNWLDALTTPLETHLLKLVKMVSELLHVI